MTELSQTIIEASTQSEVWCKSWDSSQSGCTYPWWTQVVMWAILILFVLACAYCGKLLIKVCKSRNLELSDRPTCTRDGSVGQGSCSGNGVSGAENPPDYPEDKLPSYEEYMKEKNEDSFSGVENIFHVEVEIPSSNCDPETITKSVDLKQEEETSPPPYFPI